MISARWYIQHGCELASPNLALFLEGVYALSGGQPCKECNCKDTCPAWPILQGQAAKATRPVTSQRLCPKCRSPLNLQKVQRRGGKCACGQPITGEQE